MFDLSAIDAELDSLGRAPENARSLAQTFAGVALSDLGAHAEPGALPPLAEQLAEVDAALSALADGSAPAQALASHARQRPRSDGPRARDVAPSHGPKDRGLLEREPVSAVFSALPASEPPPASASRPLEGGAEPRASTLTQSQEIVLPDPIAREELSSESGELGLFDQDPSSGSFELPDSPTEPRIGMGDHARVLDAMQAGALLPFDDVQDALEGSQPIAVPTRARFSSALDFDRDPDAEFDALLSEATDPRGVPNLGASGELDTDDLLRGLEGDEGDEDDALYDEVDDDALHEADLLTRSLDEESDATTDILDATALGALQRAARTSGPTRADEETAVEFPPDELDSGELELLEDEEPTPAPQKIPFQATHSAAPPQKPARPRAPSGPPGAGPSHNAPPAKTTSASPEKRPSGGLLGRLFTKRDGE